MYEVYLTFLDYATLETAGKNIEVKLSEKVQQLRDEGYLNSDSIASLSDKIQELEAKVQELEMRK